MHGYKASEYSGVVSSFTELWIIWKRFTTANMYLLFSVIFLISDWKMIMNYAIMLFT